MINETPTKFPAVTICNLNPSFLNIENYHSKYTFEQLDSLSREFDLSKSINEKYQIFNKLETLFYSLMMNDSITDLQRKNLSLPLDKILLRCSFNMIVQLMISSGILIIHMGTVTLLIVEKIQLGITKKY